MTTLITANDLEGRQFLTAIAAAYDKSELTAEEAQLVNERGDELAAGMHDLLARLSKRAPDYTVARQILGKDFIAPEEIAAVRGGITYNPEQLLELGDTVPSTEVLEWCRDNGFMVVAGPSRPMSLLDIRELERSHFYFKTEGWYANPNEVFARNDKAICRWLLIRKEPISGSTSKTWDEQTKLLSDLEAVPNVAEQVWTMTTYKAVRGIYPLSSIYVRTSSVGSGGGRVHVGRFDGDGLSVFSWSGHDRRGFLGVSSSRK